MAFNTGNPVPSSDAKDLSDNAENFDDAVNSQGDTWQDRLLVTRDTVNGRIKKMGYAIPVIYGSGIIFDSNDNVKTVEEDSVIYAPLPGSLPFTTTGIFANDQSKFFPIQNNDHSLLSNLGAFGDHSAIAISRGASSVDADLTVVETEVSGKEESGVAASLVTDHNADPSAHVALSGFITSEADRAEAAADAATLSGNIYADTVAGLAATVDKDYFSVVSADNAEYLILYLNNVGVAVQQKIYPSVNAVISPESTDFIAQTVNLYDESASLKGFFMDKNGALTASGGFNVSDFIEVEPSTTYTFSADVNNTMRFYTAFDASEVVVPAEGSDVAESQIFTPASGVKFYKITVRVADNNTAQLEKGVVSSAFEPFGFEHTVPIVDIINVVDRKVTPESTSFLLETPNIYNKATSLKGFFAGSNGVPVADSSFNLSDFIEIIAGETYTYSSGVGSTMRFYTAYDEFKAVVQVEGSDSAESQIFVPSSGIKYYKITVLVGDDSTAQLEVGAVATALKGFGYEYTIPIADQTNSESEESPYFGLKFTTFGDSITEQNKWQPFLTEKFGLELTNLGDAGTTVSGAGVTSMNNDVRVDTIPLDTDILTVLGGTNDWAQSVPLGLIDSVDITDFYGAFNVMIGKIYTRIPTARIFIMTTTYGTFNGPGWPNSETNLVGLTANDYAEACRVMSKVWGTPLIDTNGECGWNTINKGDFLADQIHPGTEGGRRMAEVVSGRFIDFEPLP